MSPHVIETLWDIQALDTSTIVKAHYTSRDRHGIEFVSLDDFYIKDINITDQTICVILKNCRQGFEITVTPGDLLLFDGMQPERFVSVYNLNWDGSNKYTGKKRGRKRKD